MKEPPIIANTIIFHAKELNSSLIDFTMNDTFSLDNVWKAIDEQYFRHTLAWVITLVMGYVLILVIGILGNIMVICVVIFRSQMRTVTNMFIMNLAVADLSVIVFCVPATLLANIFTPWILGSFMCKAVAYVQGVSVCASAYSLAAISVDRCKAIYRPLEKPRGLSKSQALYTTCLIWSFALLMTIPWTLTFNVMISPTDGLTYCIETWENEQLGKTYFLLVNFVCYYCIPLVIIFIANVIIWFNVTHRKIPQQQDSGSAAKVTTMHQHTRNGVRKMLSIVTLTFLLSWLPLYIIVTMVKFSNSISDDESSLLEILLPLAQWLGSWNSSINPALYAFLNKKFREMFASLLPAWVPWVPRKQDQSGVPTNATYNFQNDEKASHCLSNAETRKDKASSRKRESAVVSGESSQLASLAVSTEPTAIVLVNFAIPAATTRIGNRVVDTTISICTTTSASVVTEV